MLLRILVCVHVWNVQVWLCAFHLCMTSLAFIADFLLQKRGLIPTVCHKVFKWGVPIRSWTNLSRFVFYSNIQSCSCHSGFCKQTPETGWLYYSHIYKSKFKIWLIRFRIWVSTYVHHTFCLYFCEVGNKEGLWDPFRRMLMPFRWAPSLWPPSLPKALPPSTMLWVLGWECIDLWGAQNI